MDLAAQGKSVQAVDLPFNRRSAHTQAIPAVRVDLHGDAIGPLRRERLRAVLSRLLPAVIGSPCASKFWCAEFCVAVT